MNSYLLSYTKKIDYFFVQKEISNIIYLYDEDDKERLDHVLFLEKNDGDVIGLYIRGMNPLISENKIHELDDFNLFDSYEGLIECKERVELKIGYVCLFFSSEYNELLGIYLSNNDASSSLFISFLQDRMDINQNCSTSEASKILKNQRSIADYITYEKNSGGYWDKIRI